MTIDYKDKLYDLYEEFSTQENANGQRKPFNKIEELLSSQPNLDSEDYHAWGMIYYMNDNDIVNRLDVAQEKFKKSVDLDADYFLARLYLAHCYHDKKDHFRALENYEKVDQSKLKKFQLWRYVKLLEQIGFCHFKLGREQTGLDYFKEVLEWYEKSELDSLAVPVEMLDCLPNDHEYVIGIKKLEDSF